MAYKKIIFTGFGPFGKWTDNPSEYLVTHTADVSRLILPVDLVKATAMVEELYSSDAPDRVVHFGLHGKARSVYVERAALNMDDMDMPDNSGRQIIEKSIDSDGPAAYITSVSVHRMVKYLKEHGLKARVSNSAGTYLCNHVYYLSAHLAAKNSPDTKVIFIHVPDYKYMPHPKLEELGMMVRDYMGRDDI